MLRVVKPPRLKRDWVGKRVRTVRTMRNGVSALPAGAMATVESYSRGAILKLDRCECCGVAPYISRVPGDWFEFVEEVEE